MTENGMLLRNTEELTEEEWNNLDDLLRFGNDLLDDSEKSVMLQTLKKIIAATNYEEITLHVLQAFIQLHQERR